MTTETAKTTAVRKPKERMFEIEVQLADDNEPSSIFIGANGQDFLIKRGKPVTVPESVLGILDNAIKGVPEKDPDDQDRVIFSQRKRFPYTILREL